MKRGMITKKGWDEFRATGLLLFVNHFLHIFGWAIVIEYDPVTKAIKGSYPAKVTFKGFNKESEEEAYKALTKHMAENAQDLLKDFKDGVS